MFRVELIDEWYAGRASGFEREPAHHENLAALLGPDYDHERAWELAESAFRRLLELAGQAKEPAVLRLIVLLTDSRDLVVEPPPLDRFPAHLSYLTPPTLLVMPPTPEPMVGTFESYSRPLPEHPFVGYDPPVKAAYEVFRALEEMERGQHFARHLLFEQFRAGDGHHDSSTFQPSTETAAGDTLVVENLRGSPIDSGNSCATMAGAAPLRRSERAELAPAREGARQAMSDWRDELPALVRAAALGADREVAVLLQDGSDPNQADERGWSALHAAAVFSHPAVVSLLLDAGALVDARDASGFTPLLNAAQAEGDVVAALLEAGADPVAQESSLGWRPLDRYADYGNREGIELVLKAGAEVEARDFSGGTALMSAAEHGHADCVELLLSAGADPSVAVEGETAFELAAEAGHNALARAIAARARPRDRQTDRIGEIDRR
jgi:ankyrin repeat protein